MEIERREKRNEIRVRGASLIHAFRSRQNSINGIAKGTVASVKNSDVFMSTEDLNIKADKMPTA